MDSIFFLVFRRMRAPLLALILSYAIAILGLVVIPGRDADGNLWHMDFFHAFYFVSYMSTTIGFGEIPQAFSDAQRMWVTFCVYATVIVWLYSIGTLIALLQDKALRRAMEERLFASRVRHINEPFYLVCGFGQTGSGLVHALTDHSQRAVVMDLQAERIDLFKLETLREFVPALEADVRQPDNLVLGGLRSPYCAGVLAVTSDSEVNLKVAIAAKLMQPEANVICRADSKAIEANMASFGTDYIYDPFELFARYLATALETPGLTLLRDWLTATRGSALREPLYPPAQGLWIICGYGRFGRALYEQLSEHGLDLVVIEARPERTGVPPGPLVEGPGTEAETLNQAEVCRAVGLVAGTDNDANNLSILMTARELNPALFTIVRQNHLMNEELFEAVDADILMHPSSIVAHQIRMLLAAPSLADFLHDARSKGDAWACVLASRIAAIVSDRVPEVWEVRVDAEDAFALTEMRPEGLEPTLGDLLRDPRERSRGLCAIALMRQRDQDRTLLPDAEEPVRAGDRFLFCGRASAWSRMQWTLQNRHALSYVVRGSSPPHGPVWRWLGRLLRRDAEGHAGR